MHSILERASAYLERMPPAIAGSGGHRAAYNAAVVLARGFALSEQDAIPLLFAWNQTHCLPPWSESELRHKWRSAARSTRPLGYLLESTSSTSEPCTPDFENDAERKARQRKAWPALTFLGMAEMETVARLRRLPVSAVILAAKGGFMAGATVDGHRCFIIREGTFAQARKFDGSPFKGRDGREMKAKNLPGSQGAFIGQKWLGGPSVRVLLVEGVIALLEALAAHELAAPAEAWTILAATSAQSRFARDPKLLARLAGRYVRIIPDGDEEGMKGAASWLADLEPSGATVDAFGLPQGCKDLGPIVAAPEFHRETLTSLFQ